MRRKPSVAGVLAVCALVLALGGTAYAASTFLITSTSQIKPSVIAQLKGHRGPRGWQGRQGPTGVNGTNGSNGAIGTGGPQGAQGLPGASGAKGDTGATGATGAQGVKGNTGSQGPRGFTGFTGAQGPKGNTGSQGPAGAPGATGAPGAQGPKGDSGVNDPLVFGPYQTTGDLDSNVCGGNWASDDFTRTYIVTPMPNGSFDVTERFEGGFTTLAGASEPGDGSCTTTQVGGITGTMQGEYVLNLAAPADFNPDATCSTTDCATGAFFSSFFDGASQPGSYAWEFYYATPSNGDWANTDHGNTGEITG